MVIKELNQISQYYISDTESNLGSQILTCYDTSTHETTNILLHYLDFSTCLTSGWEGGMGEGKVIHFACESFAL